MARRKRKKTALKLTKGKKRPAAARKKAAKPAGRKTATRKVAKRATVKAKAKKRAVRKKAVPPAMEGQQVGEAAADITETTVVDIVEEPAPGVVVVTEIETVKLTTPPEDDEEEGD